MSTIQTVAEWFIAVKAPDLKDKINAGLKIIDSGEQLEGNYKKLFGFILFSYSMNNGPASFFLMEKIAEEINVIEDLKEWANNWINHSKQKSAS